MDLNFWSELGQLEIYMKMIKKKLDQIGKIEGEKCNLSF